MPYNLLIINGPNLGRLGERQPEIYGHFGLDELPGLLMEFLGGDFNRVEFFYYQSNHEGELIDRLEEAHDAGSYFFKTLKSLLDEVPTFKAFTEESGILKKPNYEKETAKNMAKISQGLDKLNESIKDLSKNI